MENAWITQMARTGKINKHNHIFQQAFSFYLRLRTLSSMITTFSADELTAMISTKC